MIREAVIYLISEKKSRDVGGKLVTEETVRKVFATVKSVTYKEVYSAAEVGRKPAVGVSLFEGDYQGEEIVEYNGTRYAVIRSYAGNGKYKDSVQDDYIQLTLEKKEGV